MPSLTLKQIRSLVQMRLEDVAGIKVRPLVITEKINEALDMIYMTLRQAAGVGDRYVTNDQTTELVNGDYEYDLPANCRDLIGVAIAYDIPLPGVPNIGLYIPASPVDFMTFKTAAAGQNSYAAGTTSAPIVTYLGAAASTGKVWISPTPTARGFMEFVYYRSIAALSADADYPDLPAEFHPLIAHIAEDLAMRFSQPAMKDKEENIPTYQGQLDAIVAKYGVSRYAKLMLQWSGNWGVN